MITVSHLSKHFRVAQPGRGLGGKVKRLLKPQFKTIRAVDEVSFQIDEGEIVGYLGPNGAGKSTTIKLLTGVLYPTSGSLRVNGLVPHENRARNAYQIGVVYGQRSQLDWDLPLFDSFEILAAMYKLPRKRYRAHLDFLIELMDMAEFLDQPVRKLSLGQKMRGDLTASLLHEPPVLYLDEPTIGLDVVRLFTTWVLWSANYRIRTGDIVFSITRPMYYGHMMLCEFVGQSLTKLLTTSLPIFGLVCFLFRPTLPSSAAVWVSFGLSLGLGFLTAFYVDYLLALIGFWTTELDGLFWAKGSILSILGGTYLPLWIYPPVLRQILAFLPFQGVSYTPVAIFVGQIGLDQVPRALVVQLVWVGIMVAGSRRLYAAAIKKLAVQGG